jgi:hypothetical protein
VVEILDEREREVVADVGPERRYDRGAVGLVPDRPAAGKRHGMRIAKSPHASQHAVVVVEGPVLLHQHDDVLYVPDAASRPVRRDRERVSDAVGQHRRRNAAACKLEELTPTDHATHQQHSPLFTGSTHAPP